MIEWFPPLPTQVPHWQLSRELFIFLVITPSMVPCPTSYTSMVLVRKEQEQFCEPQELRLMGFDYQTLQRVPVGMC